MKKMWKALTYQCQSMDTATVDMMEKINKLKWWNIFEKNRLLYGYFLYTYDQMKIREKNYYYYGDK